MRLKEIQSKTILVRSKLPDTDYVVNPYIGCQFACSYCYASFMGRFVNEPIVSWGDYIYVKVNATNLFEKEIEKLIKKSSDSTILLSSVTDPYQGIEKEYEITRNILKLIRDFNYRGRISILTKSPIVLRDLDIIKQIRDIEVGITITTTDDNLSRSLEAHAPSASKRIKTLHTLNQSKINTYAFLGPLLPHYKEKVDQLEELLIGIKQAGTDEIYVEHMNISKYIYQRLILAIQNENVEIQNLYKHYKKNFYKKKLDSIVLNLIKKHKLQIRLGGTIDHKRKHL